MKKSILLATAIFATTFLFAQVVEKTFTYSDYSLVQAGDHHLLLIPGTLPSGMPGEPALPYQSVALILPPGEKATSSEIIREGELEIPGTFLLYPQQHVRPLSEGASGIFIKDHATYEQDSDFPADPAGHLTTQYMNGFSVALTSFTPVRYNPARGTVSLYRKVTVRIRTAPDPQTALALENYSGAPSALRRLQFLAGNPEAASCYPAKPPLKSGYQILIITSQTFSNSFQELIDHYQNLGMACQVATTQDIGSSMTGQDLQEKIRNFIIQEYQGNGVEFVLLGGDAEIVPFRGFYCQVQSSTMYEDDNIPADLYYSALDGTWNNNGNDRWGEPGEDDLLPDVAVTRFPFSTGSELQHMIQKSLSYQETPVLGELQQPLMAGEHLWDNPLTLGGDFMELLIDDQTAHGYFTHGIPSAENTFVKLYDTVISPGVIYNWDPLTLLNEINLGKSFIHHLGHANEMYMMRLYIWDITDQNFSQVNGVDHNYTLLYTQGCLCGAFDSDDCIAEKAVTIENFLAAGVFNSRYGWFNEGQTDGPSQHLQREFVSALYNDTTWFKRIGETHMISKIKTSPWVTAPGQWEPGALRWCFYCCNVFGDAAMEIWTEEPSVGLPETEAIQGFSLYPNPAHGSVTLTLAQGLAGNATVTISTLPGQEVIRHGISADRQNPVTWKADLSGLKQGLYLVTVKTQAGEKTMKLIVR